MQALFAARKREETDGFKDIYRHQAGIEEPIRKECARWALRLGEGPRVLGFSMLVSSRVRGRCNLGAWHKRRYKNLGSLARPRRTA